MVSFIAPVYLECASDEEALGIIHPSALGKHWRWRRLDDVSATDSCADTFVHWCCSNNFVSFYTNFATNMVIYPEFLSEISETQVKFCFSFKKAFARVLHCARYFLWTKTLQRHYEGCSHFDLAAFHKVSIE